MLFKWMKNLLLDTISAVFQSIPDRTRSMLWWRCATPKNNGVRRTAVVGRYDCSSNGIIQARNVNSSDSGATMWFRIHNIFLKLSTQYTGSKYNFHTPFIIIAQIGPKNNVAVSNNGTNNATKMPFVRNPMISHIVMLVDLLASNKT